MGTLCSRASLAGHTSLPNGKGAAGHLHYRTHLGLAPDKVTGSSDLLLEKIKATGAGSDVICLTGVIDVRGHALASLKGERRIYCQYLIRDYCSRASGAWLLQRRGPFDGVGLMAFHFTV